MVAQSSQYRRAVTGRLGSVLVITADVREERARVPLLLEQFGVTVTRTLLPAGDYICGPGTVVERKSVDDLHKTITAGRFWSQMGRIREAGRSPCLIIEGERLMRGPVGADSIRGACLAAADLGIAVIRTDDVYDSARWLLRLAQRRQEGRLRDRPLYAQRPRRSRVAPSSEVALAAAPGISVATARALLAHFGSLRKIVLASEDALMAVPGVGRKRALALRSMIHAEWTPDHLN